MWNPCKKIKLWYRRKKESQKRAELTHLAPQDDAFDCSKPQSIKPDKNQKAPSLHIADSYYQYLDRALADPHVYNIALAGHFGCGKSTILQTYEKHYAKKRRFLNISLATFGEDGGTGYSRVDNVAAGDDGEHHTYNDDTSQQPPRDGTGRNGHPASQVNESRRQNHLVEHSILQQIFYQVPKNRIPRSRFKRISKPGVFLPWTAFLFWLICVGAAVALFKPAVFVNARYVNSIITAKSDPGNMLLTLGGLFAFALPAIIIFRQLRSITLRKLNLKNCEIEIDEGKDPSALNKHLDEILYFFEETDFDVVVLEDLDRFRTTDVFTKLREINTLVNRNIQARRREWLRYRTRTPRRVVFIYAIKDDMFTGEERTKFFDLVIPVIPVVNHTNSRELLTQALHARGLNDVSDELINDVAIFVRDMRLLHNVVNEYAVYRRRLNMDGLDPQKLFAMILYKNVCPEDFAKLHDSKGQLYECVSSKVSLINRCTQELRKEHQSLKERITAADSENLVSLRELRALYVFELLKRHRQQTQRLSAIHLKDKYYSWESLTEDEPFLLLVGLNGSVQDEHGYNVNVSFPAAEKIVDAKRTYAEREDLILSREGEMRQQLEQKLEHLENRIRELRHAKLAHLLEITGPGSFPSETPSVVQMLLGKGYIDETTFLSYLSYFYEGSLSNSDWVFVQGIKTGQTFEPEYALGNVKEIVERNLGPEERISQACQNIHLLHYMAATRRGDFPKVVERLKREPEEAVELVLRHLANGTHSPACVIQLLHRHWPEFAQAVLDYHDLSTLDWKRYMQAVILHLSADNLKAVIDSTQFRLEVALNPRFVPLLTGVEDADRATAFLGAVRPLFQQLPEMDKSSPVSQFIYDHGLYAISAHNIILLHRLFIGELPDEFPPTITSLREQEGCKLAQQVDANLNAYVGVLLDAEGSLRREGEPIVVSLLNGNRLSKETVVKLLDGRCVPVDKLDSIEFKERWPDLLGNRSLRASWENVFAYHHECAEDELDEVLIDYLADIDVASKLSRQAYSSSYSGSSTSSGAIMGQVLASKRIPTSSVQHLLRALPEGATFADASAIAAPHLPVAHPWIRFTVDNYEHIRTHAAPSIGEFVKGNLQDFYRLISELTIDGENLSHILSAHPRQRRKREITSKVFSNGVPNNLAPVADQLCGLMVEEEDFAAGFTADTLAAIIYSVRDRSTKIQSLIRFGGQLANEGILEVLRSAGDPYRDIAVAGKRPRLPKGDMNSELANFLKGRDLISSFSVDDDGVNIYTFRGEE